LRGPCAGAAKSWEAGIAGCLKLSTDDLPANQRRDWLREVTGREYANVEITPPADGRLFNEMTIYPWNALRLSSIRSNAITIERSPNEPAQNGHDAYFAVLLLSGSYTLEQTGRNVVLQPGDMTLYDATLPHRIFCPASFTKLIVSIPRPLLRERAPSVEHCTVLRIPGREGIGAIAGDFMRSCARHADALPPRDFSALSEHGAGLLTLAFASLRPAAVTMSPSRSLLLLRIKDFVERNLRDPGLNTAMVASGVRLSPRYINDIFKDEETSLMRHVWSRRLENCRTDLLSHSRTSQSISDIALRWRFNDFSHFSRAFKQSFGHSPRDYRQRNSGRGCTSQAR
jgi:AraC-like DNA-binding protein/mannose-6-phosphate isomerase-like protein (cupin superfamily)